MRLQDLSKNPPSANYKIRIQSSYEVFGAENVITKRYENHTDLMNELFEALDIKIEEKLEYTFKKARKSLTEEGVNFLDAYNYQYPRLVNNKINVLRKFDINCLYDHAADIGRKKFSLKMSLFSRKKVLRRIEK